MSSTIAMNSFFAALMIGIACMTTVLLFLDLYLYIIREKTAQSFLKLSIEERIRIIEADKTIVILLGLMLWLSPIYMLLFPFILFYYIHISLILAIGPMALFVATILRARMYRQWMIKRLEGNKNLEEEIPYQLMS